LIVATSPEQIDLLAGIQKKASANGLVGSEALQIMTSQEAQAMEPELQCLAALWSPSTGIIDSHALMLSYLGDMENAGGLLALQSGFDSAEIIRTNSKTQFVVRTLDGTEILANQVINAAGLYAPQVARQFGGTNTSLLPQAYYAKGNYFSLSGRSPFTRLIYPVPEAAGLGVHLTLDMAGQAKFGPDVEWVDSPDDLTVDAHRGPGLQDGALMPAYAGIRPKINAPHETAADFCIMGPSQHGVPGLVHLMGIESPGLTSSLAIADEVVQLLA
jgi:L-2-hydroxyglutarate oxidase LhgO